ncbi:hypothetical protein QBC35DRAFT_384433, partial [Podospora australis]
DDASDKPEIAPRRFVVVDGRYQCAARDCKSTKLYQHPGELRKHQKNHTRPEKCGVCGVGRAEKKDVYRHMWRAHLLEAIEQNIPQVSTKCHFPGCTHKGRRDNVTRHLKTVHAPGREKN